MKKGTAYFFVVMGAFCWGFIGLFNRMLGEAGISVWTRVTIRNFFSLILLTIVFAIFHRQVFHIRLKHLPLFAAAGLISVLCYAVTYFNCQVMCSLAVASVLCYLAPSFVVLMSTVLWKTPLTRRKIAALILSLIGCGLVSGVMSGSLTASYRGILLGIASGFCYATYTIFAHYGLQHYDSLTMTYWTFFFSGLGSLVFFNRGELQLLSSSAKGIVGTAGLVIIATVLPYILYTKGLEQVESGRASIIANVEPVVSALTGLVFFHERMTLWTLLGMLCVLSGVVILAGDKESGVQ